MPAGWVSAAAAVGSAVESGVANSNAASAAKKNNAGAAQLAGAQGSMLGQAQSVAQQPFTPYTGTLTAPMSGNEQQGYSLAGQTASTGLAQQDNAQATGLIGQVANNPWNATTASNYMNPYTKDVTDVATAAANKNYLQNLAGVQTNAAGSGAFGGSREAIQEGELAGQNQLNIGNLTATGNANAYNNALTAWGQDNQTKLNAAQAYETAGNDVTQMTSQQISDLVKTGGIAQVINQTDLANQYGQFMRQQNWSAQQLGSLISAVGSAKGSPTQQAPVQSNTANQLLGLGSTVAGLFGGSSSSSDPFAGTSLANTSSAVGAYNQNNAPTSGDISNLTGGAATYTPIDTGLAAPG